MIKLNDLLVLSAKKEASDIHLTAGLPPVLRIHKRLVYVGEEKLTQENIAEMIFSIMRDRQKKLFYEKREYDFSYGVKGVARFRINVFYQRGSIAAAFRRIPFEIPPLDSLGVPEIAHTLVNLERGLVLVTGPTGHGKSTTLASIIEEINKGKSKHIVTIEDPIEYLFQHKSSVIVQRELGTDTLSFPGALRAVLREDPDVILVGEMRDLDTIATALTAAETGHLVFATLHTNSAAGAVPRLLDMGVEDFFIASTLNAVVAQRLVRKICPECKEEYEPPKEIEEGLRKTLEDLAQNKTLMLKDTETTKIVKTFMAKKKLSLYRGKGCSKCEGGYKGRVGIFELLTMSERISQATLDKSPASKVQQIAIEEGMTTLIQEGYLRALEGSTSLEEVMRVTK